LIAGTNGKGSVAAFCDSILRVSGIKTGLYTSPHLVAIEERICCNGARISAAHFARLTQRVKDAIADLLMAPQPSQPLQLERHPTYFEVVTAIAFLWFAEQQIEVAVLEVGMGGRFDATNIVDPLVAVITNVAFDHQRYLGHRLEEIAWEKAGIIKIRTEEKNASDPSRTGLATHSLPVITAAENAMVLDFLENQCRAAGARLIQVQEHFHWQSRQDPQGRYQVILDSTFGKEITINIPLPGRHQIDNVLTAIAVMEILKACGYTIQPAHVSQGVAETRWPGRLEIIPFRPRIILDGAHNPAGAEKVREYIQALLEREKTVMIFAVMQDKPFQEIARILFPCARQIILTRPAYARSANPEYIKNGLPEFANKLQITGSVQEAIDRAFQMAAAEDTLLMVGSLFLVGEARQCLRGMGILKNSDD
jgi:dihydrofolate synthase/folylpolyglutamate synthase